MLRLRKMNGVERRPVAGDSVTELTSEVSNDEASLLLLPGTREDK